jgi:hypothetical protein
MTVQFNCPYLGIVLTSTNIAILYFLDTSSNNLTFAVSEIVEILIFIQNW